MPQPDKVCAHIFYQLHFRMRHAIGHGGGYTGVVFMAVGAF
jgi:hypothetical protein